jgi:purine catabolism regulator
VARQALAYVAQLGGDARVGIGGTYPGVAGLRWSFYEAREALTRGPGINAREPLSLPGLLLASDALPLAELGRAVLAPLLDAGLVETLRAYLEEDASVSRVAARLFVHRNTVRYRLEQIERLTGRSLAATQDRVQFWLALHAVALGAGTAQPDTGNVRR